MSRSSSGNGDTCPVAPDHGHMFVLNSVNDVQYCADQSHDAHGKAHPSTRNFWPTGHRSFAAAVTVYHGGTTTTKAAVEPSALPTLDITLEV